MHTFTKKFLNPENLDEHLVFLSGCEARGWHRTSSSLAIKGLPQRPVWDWALEYAPDLVEAFLARPYLSINNLNEAHFTDTTHPIIATQLRQPQWAKQVAAQFDADHKQSLLIKFILKSIMYPKLAPKDNPDPNLNSQLCIQSILSAGFNINEKTFDDQTCLSLAITNRAPHDIIERLISLGADIFTSCPNGGNLLHVCCDVRPIDQLGLRYFLNKLDPNVQNLQGSTPLMQAIKNNDLNAIYLLWEKTNLDIKDKKNLSVWDHLGKHNPALFHDFHSKYSKKDLQSHMPPNQNPTLVKKM